MTQPIDRPPREARCELTELPVSGCAHCRGHDDRLPALADTDIAGTFIAQFDGPCGYCDGRVRTGEVAGRLRDGGGYVCVRCLP